MAPALFPDKESTSDLSVHLSFVPLVAKTSPLGFSSPCPMSLSHSLPIFSSLSPPARQHFSHVSVLAFPALLKMEETTVVWYEMK